MKTAVSLPDELFARAEALAHRTGRSRSSLYAEALRCYLDAAEAQSDEVTAALDALYADEPAPAATAGLAAGRALIDDGRWEW